MSALPKIIEGTWEEVARHAPELAGHRLRVIVLDQPDFRQHPAFDTSPEAVGQWVARLRDWAMNRPPVQGPVDDSRESIYRDLLS